MSAGIELLPASWLAAQLGDVVNYGKAEKAQPSGIESDTWVLELEDVERDTSRVLQRLTFASRQSKSAKNKFEKDDVLYGKLRPYLNKVVHADAPGVCTTEIVPLRPNPAIFGRYLFYWLRHPAFLDYVTEVSHGLDMPRLGTDAGKLAPLVLAPYAEQQRIADKLDAVLARVDACRERLARVTPLLQRFRHSVLSAATSGRLTEDWRGSPERDHWVATTFGNAVEELRYGTSQKCGYEGGSHAVLRIPNIGSKGEIDLSDLKFADFDDSDVERFALREGDLLLIRSNGSVDLVGKSCIVSGAACGLLFAGYLIRLRFKRDLVLPRFAYLSISEPGQRQRIERISKSTSGVNNINSDEVRSLPLHLPPVEEQAEIVRRVEILFAFADRLEARLAQAQVATDRLTPALLAKAFRGELVPQDPADEPAAELLKRLVSRTPERKSRARL